MPFLRRKQWPFLTEGLESGEVGRLLEGDFAHNLEQAKSALRPDESLYALFVSGHSLCACGITEQPEIDDLVNWCANIRYYALTKEEDLHYSPPWA